MRSFLLFALTFTFQLVCYSQLAEKVINDVITSQGRLSAVAYTLRRTDTFVTGQSRIIKGQSILQPEKQDKVFGFLFWSRRDDINRETIYDGRMGFEVNNEKKTYTITSAPGSLPHILGAPGGQIIFEQLVKLDTAGAIRFSAAEDNEFYYLTMHYADIKEYDVHDRYTRLWIDKKLLLPLRMRKHQKTLEKVQDLFYEVTTIKINEAAQKYDFRAKAFLNDYSQQLPAPNKELLALKDKTAPSFALTSFTNLPVSSSQFEGKVVLLDFWEVWCGPCIAAMPKVDALYEKYRDKGLMAFGITCEKDQLEPARKMVEKRKMMLPMLIGNEKIQKDYSVRAVPLYVVINKKGKVSFLSEGYSDDLENAIQKALAE